MSEAKKNMGTAKDLRIVTAFLTGIVVTVMAATVILIVRAGIQYTDYKHRVASHESVSMGPLSVNPSWIVAGSPRFRIAGFGSAPGNSAGIGIWECVGPAKFTWYYGVDETIHILEGSVDIEYMGKKFTLNAGDTTHFSYGTSATWTVRNHVKKTFAVYKLDLFDRIARRLFM